MSSPEIHTPIKGESLRSAHRRSRNEFQRYEATREQERQIAVSSLLAKLTLVNEEHALRPKYEVVFPLTRTGRLIRPSAQAHIIPAEVYHKSGKSTFGGWVNFMKTTGQYLLVKPEVGYPIELAGSEKVLFNDGRVGAPLARTARGIYTHNELFQPQEYVKLGRPEDDFQKRLCDAVWGPSIVETSSLSLIEAEQIEHVLGELVLQS